MNTSPSAKTILCFGDSNTFGQRSDDVNKGRWPADERWTGRLQSLLGEAYYIIEEGLSSRTTDLEYAKKPGRNGKTYLVPCIQSQNPIDLTILMLGTNDLKNEFNRSAQDVADAVAGLVDDIQKYAENAERSSKILVVSPIFVDDTTERFAQLYTAKYSHESVKKSKQLAECMSHVATAKDCDFFDAATVARPGEDGIHFSRDSHEALAKALASKIQSIFP